MPPKGGSERSELTPCISYVYITFPMVMVVTFVSIILVLVVMFISRGLFFLKGCHCVYYRFAQNSKSDLNRLGLAALATVVPCRGHLSNLS